MYVPRNFIFDAFPVCLFVFSGGTTFVVSGQNMDVVQQPRLLFYISETSSSRRKRQVTSSTVLLESEVGNSSSVCTSV